MNFCKAGTRLSSLQMAESSAVPRRSSTSLNTTLSGFVLAADVMVNESPIPPATRLSIVVGLFTSCTMFNVSPAAWQAASTRSAGLARARPGVGLGHPAHGPDLGEDAARPSDQALALRGIITELEAPVREKGLSQLGE